MIKKNIPNILTLMRIGLIPIIIICFHFEGNLAHYLVTTIFIFASITDYIDGSLARKFSAKSNFGRMLDPIADKMLVASILVMLVDKNMAPVIPIIIILCREIFISGMREYLAGSNMKLPVSYLGKLKTAIQMTAIIIILLGDNILKFPYSKECGIAILWLASGLTIFSAYYYVKSGLNHVLNSDALIQDQDE